MRGAALGWKAWLRLGVTALLVVSALAYYLPRAIVYGDGLDWIGFAGGLLVAVVHGGLSWSGERRRRRRRDLADAFERR